MFSVTMLVYIHHHAQTHVDHLYSSQTIQSLTSSAAALILVRGVPGHYTDTTNCNTNIDRTMHPGMAMICNSSTSTSTSSKKNLMKLIVDSGASFHVHKAETCRPQDGVFDRSPPGCSGHWGVESNYMY